MVLIERLKDEVEGKRAILQNQTGFRKETKTIDNIYIKLFSKQADKEKK